MADLLQTLLVSIPRTQPSDGLRRPTCSSGGGGDADYGGRTPAQRRGRSDAL